MRDEVRHLLKTARDLSDGAPKRELAARAFELAQRAEVMERAGENPEILKRNISRYTAMPSVWQDNVSRITDQIAEEIDNQIEQMLRSLLIQEEGRFGERAWKLELVGRHIYDSNKRIRNQNIIINRIEHAGYDGAAFGHDRFSIGEGLFYELKKPSPIYS